MTPEQQARDMMERAGWDGAQGCSAGDVVEIANLISDNERLRGLLRDLHALVMGECPSLLDEDRDGDGRLALAIDDALGL